MNEYNGGGGNIVPTRWARHNISHYYGDFVREFFVGVAILSLVAIPIFGDLLPFGLLPQIASTLLLVFLAGITNPRSKGIFVANAIVAAIGALLLEATAISLYAIDSTPLFVAREAAAIALMFAFYYSVKTLRAMMFGYIGTHRPLKFDEPNNTTKE